MLLYAPDFICFCIGCRTPFVNCVLVALWQVRLPFHMLLLCNEALSLVLRIIYIVIITVYYAAPYGAAWTRSRCTLLHAYTTMHAGTADMC